MKRRTRRQQRRGGKAIARGSDGCVFDGTFASDGTFTKTTDTVTKVYPPEFASIAANEFAQMKLVGEATGGVGVVIASSAPTEIATIPDSAWDNDKIKGEAACKRIVDASAGPFQALVLPRVDGTLVDNPTGLTAKSFEDLEGAIASMQAERLVHMDFAARNIFRRGDTLLLGDFGTTVNLRDPALDEVLQRYVARYRLRGDIRSCQRMDGIHPFAVVLLVFYDALLLGKGVYDAFLKVVREDPALTNLYTFVSKLWIAKRLDQLAQQAPDSISESVTAFYEQLELGLGKILNTFIEPSRTYETAMESITGIRGAIQRYLLRSDPVLLETLKLSYQSEPVTPARVDALTKVWFPTWTPPSKSAGVRRTRRKRVKMSRRR